MSNEKSALLLVAHGSRDAAWNQEVRVLADRVRSAAPFPRVELAFLGLIRPSIPEGVAACAEAGARAIAVVPLLLFPATHAREDLPASLAEVSRQYRGVRIRLAPLFGEEEEIVAILHNRLEDAARGLGVPSAEQGVVLVSGGSNDPEANAIVGRAAARLQARSGRPRIQVAYWEHADPSLDQGVAQAVSAGARGIVVLPYLLFAGTILDRIRQRVRALVRSSPQASLRMGEHLGPHPLLASLVVRRAERVLEKDRGAD
jgi:sirohydrochlorin cobaltochelatase